MTFTCYINKRKVILPLSFNSEVKCQNITKPDNASIPRLAKMERAIAYSEIHGEKMLKEISDKLRKDCCSDSPNAFWKREKYFVSLPYDPLQRIKPMKASARIMTPSERAFCEKEIAELLQKGLIEPSKSPWACRAFVVNKHSEQKRGKPRLVVNFKPLNAILQKVRYPLPDKSSLLQRIIGNTIFSKFDLK